MIFNNWCWCPESLKFYFIRLLFFSSKLLCCCLQSPTPQNIRLSKNGACSLKVEYSDQHSYNSIHLLRLLYIHILLLLQRSPKQSLTAAAVLFNLKENRNCFGLTYIRSCSKTRFEEQKRYYVFFVSIFSIHCEIVMISPFNFHKIHIADAAAISLWHTS